MKRPRIELFRFLFLMITASFTLFLVYFHFFIADTIHKELTQLCHKKACLFRGTIAKKGMLYPKIIIQNVEVAPTNQDNWHLQAKTIECSFSLARLLFTYWNIPISITIHGLDSYSVTQKGTDLAIFDILDLFADTPGQFFRPKIHSAYTQNAQIKIKSKQFNVECILQFHGRLSAGQDETLEGTMTIIDGKIKQIIDASPIISSISGIIQSTHQKQDNKFSLQTKGILFESKEAIYLKGTGENDFGRLSLSTSHPQCYLDPIIYTRYNSKVSGQISLLFIQKILQKPELLHGIVALNFAWDHTKQKNALRGQIVLEDGAISGKRLCSSAKITISSKESSFYGPVVIKTTFGNFSGNYLYDFHTQSGECMIKSTQEGKTAISPFVSLHNKSINFRCNIYKQNYSLHASCDIFDTLKHKTYKNNIDAMLSHNEGIQIRGNFNTVQLIGFLLWKKEYNGILSLTDSQQELACMKIQQNNGEICNFSGYAQTNLIKTALEFFIQQPPLYGEGILSFCGTKENNTFTTKYSVEGSAIDLPFVHNFLIATHGTVAINPQEKKISIAELNTKFSTGSLSCNNAEIIYDDTWAIRTCSIPIKINKCAVSPHNFFDTLISAKTHIYKNTKTDPFFVAGTVRFHHGFIKNDEPVKKIFSEQHFFPLKSPLHIEHAIDFESEKPIRIETKQIKTDISVKITSTGHIESPRLHGSITCNSGEILFPYKPLHITHGKVILSGGDFQDATIKLFARNVVKNYKIAMHASGSIAKHSIFFDAAPFLSQAQISSLLFFGSLQENISIFMPSLFSHTIRLGSLDIHFVPGFVDKSSRGGIRGALEIAINNRLRATIQKNFTLSEDTRFELEYAITDTILLRAVRDERRDLGGELELRWKF